MLMYNYTLQWQKALVNKSQLEKKYYNTDYIGEKTHWSSNWITNKKFNNMYYLYHKL